MYLVKDSSGRNGRELAPRSQVHPDLEKERQNCPFSQEEITNLIDGGPDKTTERRSLEEYFFSFPEVSTLFFIRYLEKMYLFYKN